MDRIRIGLLGAGAMGAEHAYCLGQIGGVAVAGVHSRSLERAASLAGPLGATPTREARTLIEDPGVDAIDVCLPTPVHGAYVMAALEAGKHVRDAADPRSGGGPAPARRGASRGQAAAGGALDAFDRRLPRREGLRRDGRARTAAGRDGCWA